jgi:hypothetical protein
MVVEGVDIVTDGVTAGVIVITTALEVTGVVEAQAALEVIRTVIDAPLVKAVEE